MTRTKRKWPSCAAIEAVQDANRLRRNASMTVYSAVFPWFRRDVYNTDFLAMSPALWDSVGRASAKQRGVPYVKKLPPTEGSYAELCKRAGKEWEALTGLRPLDWYRGDPWIAAGVAAGYSHPQVMSMPWRQLVDVIASWAAGYSHKSRATPTEPPAEWLIDAEGATVELVLLLWHAPERTITRKQILDMIEADGTETATWETARKRIYRLRDHLAKVTKEWAVRTIKVGRQVERIVLTDR